MTDAVNVGDGDTTARAARILDLLAGAERAIAQLAPDDLYSLCRLLHDAAAQAGPVDSFYVCQYDAQTESMYFPFNFDEGRYDDPDTMPLGNGPTAKVIRTGAPYFYPESAQVGRTVQSGGVPFGNPARLSETAVHLPLLDRSKSRRVMGVVSVQSYQPNAFDTLFLRFFTSLAERAASVWVQWEARRDLDLSLRQARQSARDLADTQVEGLKRIVHQAEDVQRLVPPSAVPLRDAVAHLRQTCYRLQTGINVLPLRPADPATVAPPVEPAPNPASSLLERLSPREWEVAQLVAKGLSNKQISDHFTVSEHTIKTQVASILTKLEIHKRGQIAPLLM